MINENIIFKYVWEKEKWKRKSLLNDVNVIEDVYFRWLNF